MNLRTFRNSIIYFLILTVIVLIPPGCSRGSGGGGSSGGGIGPWGSWGGSGSGGGSGGEPHTALRCYLQSDGSSGSAPSWTVMIYMAADNNLNSFAQVDMQEMANAGANDNFHVVVFWDRDEALEPPEDFVCENIGEVDSGSPETLKNFLKWATGNFPADRYMLVLWNHGEGWRQVEKTSTEAFDKAILQDDDTGKMMYVYEIRQVLQDLKDEGINLELLGMDACLMGMFEVAYNLGDLVPVIVASETTEPAEGWYYTSWLQELKDNPNKSALEIGKDIVDSYIDNSGGEVLAVFDTSKLNDVRQKIDNLAQALISEVSAGNSAYITHCFNNTTCMYYEEYKDLRDLADNIRNCTDFSGDTINAANDLYDALSEGSGHFIYYYREKGTYYGVSIYAPTRGDQIYDPSYGSSLYRFASDSLWDNFLKIYHQ